MGVNIRGEQPADIPAIQAVNLVAVPGWWRQVPDEVFMLLVSDKKVMSGVSGTAYYRQEFDSAI